MTSKTPIPNPAPEPAPEPASTLTTEDKLAIALKALRWQHGCLCPRETDDAPCSSCSVLEGDYETAKKLQDEGNM